MTLYTGNLFTGNSSSFTATFPDGGGTKPASFKVDDFAKVRAGPSLRRFTTAEITGSSGRH